MNGSSAAEETTGAYSTCHVITPHTVVAAWVGHGHACARHTFVDKTGRLE